MGKDTGQISPAKIFARSTPGTIWLGPTQVGALNHLASDRPLKVLLGPASSGKSTTLQRFQQQADEAVVLPVAGPKDSAVGVLSSLLTAAGLTPWNLSEIEQRNLLTVFVRQRSLIGKRVVLCVDNVSRFEAAAWSEIERLRLLQFGKKQIFELIVVGTEEDAARAPLFELLHESATSAVEAVHFVSAPTDDDVHAYIGWRFAQVGLPNPFSCEASRAVNGLTQGRLNFVNILCQVVLLEQQRESTDVIDASVVRRAAAALATIKQNTSTGDTIRIKHLDDDDLPSAGRLVISRSGNVMQTVALRGRLLIGRDADNDLLLSGPHTSRHHAAITPTAEGYFCISDLNSANGVRVNGERVERSLLRDGDVVGLGQFKIKVELSARSVSGGLLRDAVTATSDTDVLPVLTYEAPGMRVVKS